MNRNLSPIIPWLERPSAFFEKKKPTTPSFRAYFITLIGVLVSWNYRLINANWNIEKLHAFSLLERRRLGLSNHNTLRMIKVLKTWCLQLTSRIGSYSNFLYSSVDMIVIIKFTKFRIIANDIMQQMILFKLSLQFSLYNSTNGFSLIS